MTPSSTAAAVFCVGTIAVSVLDVVYTVELDSESSDRS